MKERERKTLGLSLSVFLSLRACLRVCMKEKCVYERERETDRLQWHISNGTCLRDRQREKGSMPERERETDREREAQCAIGEKGPMPEIRGT